MSARQPLPWVSFGVVMLVVAAGANDDAPKDQPKSKKARVLLVSSGNLALDAFFSEEVSGNIATVTRLKPANLKDEEKYGKPATKGVFDLVIFDCCAPEKTEHLPKGNTLFIGHPPPPWKLGEMKRVDNPSIKSWAKKHPLLKDLDRLKDLGIVESYQFKELPKGAEQLIEGDKDTVLLMALPRKPFTDLVLTFPLFKDGAQEKEWNTTWPLRPSFVVFLGSVVHILGNINEAN
jgi:hypothetical protein